MPASKVGGSGPEIAVILHRGGAREEKKKKEYLRVQGEEIE